MREISGELFIFHQTHSVYARQSALCGTEDILVFFTRPVVPKSPDLNPFDYKICTEMQQRLYQMKVDKLKQRMLDVWRVAWSKSWSMMCGAIVSVGVCVAKEDILSI